MEAHKEREIILEEKRQKCLSTPLKSSQLIEMNQPRDYGQT